MPAPLLMHQLVFVHGKTKFQDGIHLVRGWGKVNSPGDQFVHVELATGLVGDDWAEIGGEKFYEDEYDDRVETIIVVARGDVFTTDELEPAEDPIGRPQHIPTEERKAAFLNVVKSTGLEFDGEDLKQYEGGRYTVIAYDGVLGIFREADTLQDLAGCIGGLLDVPYAYGGWYDLDDEEPHPHAASWAITVNHGDEYDTADGDLLV